MILDFHFLRTLTVSFKMSDDLSDEDLFCLNFLILPFINSPHNLKVPLILNTFDARTDALYKVPV
jgi:hypothetical protein